MTEQSENLSWLNDLSATEAKQQLLQCCGSRLWAETVIARRPYKDFATLIQTSEDIWWQLDSNAWLEAFKSHPKIGEKKAAATGTARTESWSENEQSGMTKASEQTTETLAKLNSDYEQKFGYIFIVCASGKSSEEMLELLKSRLANEPAEELPIAAAEQAKITRLRLAKLIAA